MSALSKFSDIRVLCVGDVMLDRFVYGTADRLSPEQPVPVVEIASEEIFPGGAANVCRNIVSLGGSCTLVGLIGEDMAGNMLRVLMEQDVRIEPRLITDISRPTTEKLRYVVQRRQLLRADRELAKPPEAMIESALCGAIEATIADCDILVVSDYAKGVCSDVLLKHCISLAHRFDIPVIVDPKHRDFERYRGASVIAPNVAELEAAAGFDVREAHSAVRASREIIQKYGIGSVLFTRAEKGLMLVRDGQPELAIAASERAIFDVAGAGDTVIGALALAIGIGLSLEDAARIANAAGGVVVGKPGTATATREEIARELGENKALRAGEGRAPIISLTQAAQLCARWRTENQRIGFTNGCFDILHAGHAYLLEFAKARCDRLVVGLNSDTSVARLKGAERPINFAENRARLLAAMGSVDAVVIFEEDTPYNVIETLLPDRLFKGADYRRENIVGAELIEATGGEILLCDLVDGLSTTSIISSLAGKKAVQ